MDRDKPGHDDLPAVCYGPPHVANHQEEVP
jgi:hypothetical protein